MTTLNTDIKTITFSQRQMTVHFTDGRKVSVPLNWYPRLFKASPQQRADWKILGRNRGIHWPKLDEDLSIEGILHGIPSVEYKAH